MMARKEKLKPTIQMYDKPIKLQDVIKLVCELPKGDYLQKHLKNVSR